MINRFDFTGFIIRAIAFAGIFTAHSAAAQDAYMAQIGEGNTGANLALGLQNTQRVVQAGIENTGVQIAMGIGNTSNLVQVGRQNAALALNVGLSNTTNTVQFGAFNQAITGIQGVNNTVTTFQSGILNQSAVQVRGNDTDVTVAQSGFGRRLSLSVEDQMVPSSAASSPSSAAGRLQVGVIQGRNDAPVAASIARLPSGTIVINPR